MPSSETVLDASRRQRCHKIENGPDDDAEHVSRDPFVRDRDRILYSAAFRRLAGVTQVVSSDEGHVFHNRLTHSLKVAQVASSAATNLRALADKDAERALGGLNPVVAETAALAHDLGHPPFGHVAETALQNVIEATPIDIRDSFEGNAQSFRIITKAAVKAGDYMGLDLTRATRNAVLKYPWNRGQAPEGKKKWGFYATEADDFHHAQEALPKDLRGKPCLEASIMDWADDVTYAVHDVDDFYRAGLLPLDELLTDGPARREFLDHPSVKSLLDDQKAGGRPYDAEAVFSDLGHAVRGLSAIHSPFRGRDTQLKAIHRFSSDRIERYLSTAATAEGLPPALALRTEAGTPQFTVDLDARFEVNLMRKLTEVFVFDCQPLMTQQAGQVAAITGVFKRFFAAANRDSISRGTFPSPYRERLKRLDQEKLEDAEDHQHRVRMVTDFICSLNEAQTTSLHRSMSGHADASINARLLV